jgi:hypothetical protein
MMSERAKVREFTTRMFSGRGAIRSSEHGVAAQRAPPPDEQE